MKNVLVAFLMIISVMAGSSAVNAMGRLPEAPGQQTHGYGSNDNYICSSYTKYEFGSVLDGTKTYYYVPARLLHGTSAPVVVHLHGMFMIGPDIYKEMIEHLVLQGNIVIHPQFNKSMPGILTEMDQNVFFQRAIDQTNEALKRLGSRAENNNITLWGHSVGGLIALCWTSESRAPRPKNIILLNPCIDISNGVPSFINAKTITPSWQVRAASIQSPVIILTGNEDTIAPSKTALDIYSALVNAPSKVVYMMQTDPYGDRDLKADHFAVACDGGPIPAFILNLVGTGDIEVDAVDYRYYWAATDAIIHDEKTVVFDMGSWGDGRPVTPIVKLVP